MRSDTHLQCDDVCSAIQDLLENASLPVVPHKGSCGTVAVHLMGGMIDICEGQWYVCVCVCVCVFV